MINLMKHIVIYIMLPINYLIQLKSQIVMVTEYLLNLILKHEN